MVSSRLQLMIEHHREELLSHPLCVKYLETKWYFPLEFHSFPIKMNELKYPLSFLIFRSSYGMYFHLIILAFYTVFLASLTSCTMYLSHQQDQILMPVNVSEGVEIEWNASGTNYVGDS